MCNIEQMWDSLSPDEKKEYGLVMNKYDFKWWLSDDPLIVAKYQVFEDLLLSDFFIYSLGLSQLLGRDVSVDEITDDVISLRKEVRGLELVVL